ncbi:hypothetical protein GGS26DRAFT_592910 [Hypomontagnella submonticulosa]|nr:hypothetical protein GGS26DRAFT_592910 [Hypomontagnella submonticulosa]
MYDIENPPPSPSIADEPYDPPTSAKGEEAPVQSDRVDEETGDTELKLGRDDKEAIDTSNIIPERTRHADPLAGTYREPGEDEGLPLEELVVEDENSAGDVDADPDVGTDAKAETADA